MKSPPEFYVNTAIVRRWKKAAADTNGLFLVFSPYVTSSTADTVVHACRDKRNCHIYTLFDPEVFLNGASSLSTLHGLLKKGISLYSLLDLHAKIVIASTEFASIGSQNLTAGGTRRREATVVVTNAQEIELIRKDVDLWRKVAVPISEEMLIDMKRLIHPFQRKAKELRSLLKEVSKQISQNESERKRINDLEAEKRKTEINAQKRSDELRKQTEERWRLANRASRTVMTKVVASEGNNSFKFTLRAKAKADLTQWILADNTVIELDGYKFYPCLLAHNWKLGFVRITKTRITFVGDQIDWSIWHTIGSLQCKIGFRANWNEGNNKTSNVYSRFSFGGTFPSFDLPMWFGLDRLHFLDPIVTNPDLLQEDVQILTSWIKDNENEIREKVLTQLLTPFAYERLLVRDRANKFFGRLGTRYSLRAGKIKGCPIVVAEQQYN